MRNWTSKFMALEYFREINAGRCSFLLGNVIEGYTPELDFEQMTLPNYEGKYPVYCFIAALEKIESIFEEARRTR